jgi:predicted ferric reductase
MSNGSSEKVVQNSTQCRPWEYRSDASRNYFEDLNRSIGVYYSLSLLVAIGCAVVFTSFSRFTRHIRHLACMNTRDQRYFTVAWPITNWCKHHLIYAPLLYHRRAAESRLWQHFTLGNLPTRFQAIFILSLIGVNALLSIWKISWHETEGQTLHILRNRAGTLSTLNLIPIVITATAQSPLNALLNMSDDSFNVIHRWIGRIAVVQAMVHAICWVVAQVQFKGGWTTARQSLVNIVSIRYGFIASLAFMTLLLQSPKMVRSWAYDVFLGIHFILVLAVFLYLWLHLHNIRQQRLLLVAIIFWALQRAYRLATLLYRSVGRSCCIATVEMLPSDALRVSLTPSAPWRHHPGQFIYLIIPSLGLWTSHPFSIAWEAGEESINQFSTRESHIDEENLGVRLVAKVTNRFRSRTISLIVRKRKGFTRKLYDSTNQARSNRSLMAFVEGPYGVQRSFASYGTVVLVAGGVGITHQLGYVKNLIGECNRGIGATRKIILVWIAPQLDCLVWVKAWMHEILQFERKAELLKIDLYVTRSGLSRQIKSDNETVTISVGRPDIKALITNEANNRIGYMAISVCAAGGLADEVRHVCRMLVSRGVNLDFIEVGFKF